MALPQSPAPAEPVPDWIGGGLGFRGRGGGPQSRAAKVR